MAGFEDLEDDIELPQLEVARVEEPRKLSRLQKKKTLDENQNSNAAMGIDTPESEARGSLLAGGVLADDANEPEVTLSEEDAQAGDNDDGDNEVVENEEVAAEAGEGDEEDGDVAAPVWDEEDEIERYFKEKSENGRGDEETDSDDSGSDSDEDYAAGGGAGILGDNPTLDDLNAETQRILRDTAARDRLGKGQKIEIKPLTGIIAKLKERRALAIARAPKPRLVDAIPNFDDILAEATGNDAGTTEQAGASTPKRATSPAAVDAEAENDGDAPAQGLTTATATTKEDIEKFMTTPVAAKDDEDDELDLEVVSDDEDDGGQAFKVVELPNTRHKEPKPSPLVFNPYNETQDMDEFEDEPLIDDGLGDDDSDSESERSWEIRKDGEEEEEGEQVQGKIKSKKKEGDDGSSDDDDEAESAGEEDEEKENINSDGGLPDLNDGTNNSGEEGDNDGNIVKPTAAPLSTAAIMLAAANAIPDDKTKRMQRRFLDTEAELSDEDGAAAAVSDDEEEDNLDDNGELADLITTEKTKNKDLRATEEYHIQWAKQNDAKELQQVLRGLENGFRRNRFGSGLDDANDEINGRLRRARFEGDDFEGLNGAFAFPSAFGAGNGGNDDEEECEDEAMLSRAMRQKILAGSQNQITSPGAIPLDEDSQAVLGLLGRTGSESQGAGWMSMAPPAAAPSRLALELRGLNSDLGKSLQRGPSFVGRQSTVVRTQNGGGMGMGSGRSFVFGRSENSNSAIVPEGGIPGCQQQQQGVAGGTQEDAGSGGSGTGRGPVSFANLRQMAGLPGSAAGGLPVDGNETGGNAGGGGGGGNGGKKKRKAAPTLVSRLKNQGSQSLHESQESLNAVSAVCMNIAQGPANKRRR